MNVVQARRNVARQIARNPTEIVITRMVEADDGAGGVVRKAVELPAQTVRIFVSSMSEQCITKEGGQVQKQRWGLLAGWDADIQPGDMFQSGRFRVCGATRVTTGGEVASWQADLEEVT